MVDQIITYLTDPFFVLPVFLGVLALVQLTFAYVLHRRRHNFFYIVFTAFGAGFASASGALLFISKYLM